MEAANEQPKFVFMETKSIYKATQKHLPVSPPSNILVNNIWSFISVSWHLIVIIIPYS